MGFELRFPAMSSVQAILAALPGRYVPGKVPKTVVYYFSIGESKYTLSLHPDRCEATPGKPANADCVVKADPAVFENLVVHGKAPGALDIARGRFKTSDVAQLMLLKDCFRPA